MAKKEPEETLSTPTVVSARVVTTLKRVPAFSGLSKAEASELVSLCRTVQYKKGRTVFSENSEGDEVYMIDAGRVKITTHTPQGRTKILGILQEGDFLGEMAVFDPGPRTATAFIHEDASIIVLARSDFLDFLGENPGVSMKIMKALCRRLREANDEIRNFTFYDQPGRLAHMLMSLLKKFPGGKPGEEFIDLKLTHQDLADMLGIARESVTKMVSTLKREGAIDVRDHTLFITDVSALEEWMR